MAHLAEALKQKGNQAYQAGDYLLAEDLYTQAIQKHSQNPLIFTNRANARLKLQKWEGAMNDCLKAIDITGGGKGASNHKAWYFLAQAQLGLNHPNEALNSAQTAYQQVLYPSPSAKVSPNDLQTFSSFVLQCKKARFTARERARLRDQGDLLAELETSLTLALQTDLAVVTRKLHARQITATDAAEAHADFIKAHETHLSGLRAVFEIAQEPGTMPPKREVPDHLCDLITFEPMHDPVVTRNGHSYERATLIEHLKHSPTDPLTREPLGITDLRPNLGLKAACEDFWESGASKWIGDW